jgi:hypothetical protein
MGSTPTASRLTDADKFVLNEMLRFGALTFEQIARRYGTPDRRHLPRLAWLKDEGYVIRRPNWFSNTRFYAATHKAVRALHSAFEALIPKPNYLPHDLTMVNLADHLLAKHPGSTWVTERELKRGKRPEPRWGRRNHDSHRPDGVLIAEGGRIGIELELEWKNHQKYAEICRWFAAHIEFSGLKWYVGSELLLERIPRIIENHGLALDLEIGVYPIPDEVQVLAWTS